MSFLSIGECLACAWNDSGALRLVRVKRAGDRLELLDFAASTVDGDEPIANSLSTLTQRVLTPSTHLVVASGDFHSSVCFDILMPKMPLPDIKQALSYELQRYLPVDYSQMVIGYRLISCDPEMNESDKLRIRVFAMNRGDWSDVLSELTNFGVHVDYLLSPYMSLDPLLSDVNDLCFSFFDSNERFVKDENISLRRMIVASREDASEDIGDIASERTLDMIRSMGFDSKNVVELLGTDEIESYLPVLLLAAFSLGPEFQESKNFFPPLPRHLKPERFRKLRLLSILFTVAAFLLVSSLILINLWETWSHTYLLRNEYNAVQDRIVVLKREIAEMEPMENDLLDKVSTAEVGIGNMSQVVHKLCLATPKRVWLLHFSSRDRKVDLSARAPAGSQTSLMGALNRSGVFKTKSSYTRRNSDGTENIYIHMLMSSPDEPKEGK